jgi:predicted site-specific integrase-resolvase
MTKTFSTTAAALRLGITAGRLRQLIRAGTVDARRDECGRYRITEADLATARQRKRRPGPSRKGESS